MTKVDEQIHDKFVNIQGGGNKKSNTEYQENSGTYDDLTGDDSKPEVSPVYEYNYPSKEEKIVGYKPSFLKAVEELKNIFCKKENNIMMIIDTLKKVTAPQRSK